MRLNFPPRKICIFVNYRPPTLLNLSLRLRGNLLFRAELFVQGCPMPFSFRGNHETQKRFAFNGWLFLISFFLVSQSLFADTLSTAPGSPLLNDANLNDVQFLGSKIGWAVGNRGVIRKTEDGGRTW